MSKVMRAGLQTRKGRDRRTSGFTLNAMLVSTAISMTVVGGVLATSSFGLKMSQVLYAQFAAQQQSRLLATRFLTEVQSAERLRIIQYNGNSISGVPAEQPQRGNALILFPELANTNQFVVYGVDPQDKGLKRYDSKTGEIFLVVPHVKTVYPFSLQDPAGNLVDGTAPHVLVAVNIEFSQLSDPPVKIGQDNHFKAYSFQTRVSRRGRE